MSTSGLNKIVTSVSALTDNIILPNSNNVVCIDTEYNRIGVKTSSPQYEIDVSGTIKANKIITSEFQSSTRIIMNEVQTNIINISNCAISFSNNNLTFDKSIFVNNDISCNNTIKGLTGKFGIASSTKADKKLMATFENNGRKKIIHFGAKGMDDYTLKKNIEQRRLYRQRHRSDRINVPDSAGSLSWHILWGDSTSKRENINAFRNKFKI